MKEPLLKAWHAVRMMATLFVLDNFKVGVRRRADELIEMTRWELFAGLLAITTASAPLPPANRPQGWRGIRVSPMRHALHASA